MFPNAISLECGLTPASLLTVTGCSYAGHNFIITFLNWLILIDFGLLQLFYLSYQVQPCILISFKNIVSIIFSVCCKSFSLKTRSVKMWEIEVTSSFFNGHFHFFQQIFAEEGLHEPLCLKLKYNGTRSSPSPGFIKHIVSWVVHCYYFVVVCFFSVIVLSRKIFLWRGWDHSKQ